MTAGSTRRKPALTRDHLVQSIGRDVSRFQDSSNAFDDVAAEVLGVDRRDLSCMTELLFRGPSTAGELAELLSVARSAVLSTLERLQLAGYARVQPGDGKRVELSEHARPWIERIWSPLWVEGQRALDGYSTRQLEAISFFASQACEIQESRAKRLRTWLAISSSHVRRPHLRGGLSPAALRRVQVFVEGNLGRPIYLRDLAARVGLSAYHFARAFKTSTGMTPRAFVEQQRIERAKRLLMDSRQSLSQVAVEAGFGTQSRLTSTLKRRTGFTPGVIRRGRI